MLIVADADDDGLLVSLMPDDFDHDPTFPRSEGSSLREHREAWLRSWLASFRILGAEGGWNLPFVVWSGGEPVGFQVLEGKHFVTRAEVDSSSFLVASARGKGLGVQMRTAILALAFDVLGAERAVTAARPGNIASRRVSERVGYVWTGRRDPVVAGVVRPIDTFELTREQWQRLDHLPVQVDGIVPVGVA